MCLNSPNISKDLKVDGTQFNGSRKKSPWKKAPPDSKAKPIRNLTLTLPLTPHGELFSGGGGILKQLVY